MFVQVFIECWRRLHHEKSYVKFFHEDSSIERSSSFRNPKRFRPIPNLRQQPSKPVKEHSHQEDEIAWNQSGPKVANGPQRPSGLLLHGQALSRLFEQSNRARPFANAAQPFERNAVFAEVGTSESPDKVFTWVLADLQQRPLLMEIGFDEFTEP